MAANLIYLYNVEWQCLRVNMLGTWNKVVTASMNYKQLTGYVDEATTPQERKRRLWRVVNYLNAVRMGYSGQGLYDTEVDLLLVKERAYFQMRYRNCESVDFGEWDWEIVRTDLTTLHKEDRATFLKILENLQKRKDFSMKKIGTLKYRTELQEFVAMMLEVDSAN